MAEPTKCMNSLDIGYMVHSFVLQKQKLTIKAIDLPGPSRDHYRTDHITDLSMYPI